MHIMLSQKNTFSPSLQVAISLAVLLSASLVSAQPGPGPNQSAMQETRDIAAAMLKELGQTLQAAMADGGPENAIGVCKTQAPEIAMKLSMKHQLKVARVGTRARNPDMGVPNEWQTQAMKQFESRLAKGDKPYDIEFIQLVKSGSYDLELRYAKPIVLQPMCTACHGTPEQISPEVKAKLDQLYPNDKAVNYKPGELRGAVVVTRLLTN
jgi:hypothetical protein